MKASTPLSLSLILLLSSYDLVNAARFSIHARPKQRRISGGSRFDRRASVVGNTSVGDVGDVEYTTDITLGGKKFTVQIDTGRCVSKLCFRVILFTLRSSDLWVAGNVPNTKNTGHVTKVQYAVDSVEGIPYPSHARTRTILNTVANLPGNILTSTLEFAGYTVDDQAFS